MAANARTGGITLQASFSATAEHLDVSYTLDNRSEEDIYLADRLFRLGPSGIVLDPSLVYTVIEGDLLTLFRGIVPIPYGTQVESPEVPLARLVRRGEKVTDLIRVSLPLRYYYPYHWVNNKALVQTHQVRLRIGYVGSRDIPAVPQPVKVDSVSLWRFSYRQSIDVQRFAETPPDTMTLRTALEP